MNDNILADLLNATQHATSPQDNVLQQFLRCEDDAEAFRLWHRHFDTQPAGHNLPVGCWLARQVAMIDERVCEQLNVILHQPRLQQLEARWRGLKKLCDESQPWPDIKLRLLNVSWSEVAKDMARAQEFDQSQLFQRIYSDEFGMPGGTPYGLLIGDFEISHRPRPGHPFNDIETLQGLTQIAAAAFAPLICAAAPQLFGLDDFQALGQHLALHDIFQQQEYLPWRSFRQQEDTRFLALTLPRIILRKPHVSRAGEFPFVETCHAPEHYLWGSAAFAFASVVIREFGSSGWFAQTRGVPRNQLAGGLVTGYEPVPIQGCTGASHILTELVISDNSERQLSELGLMALCQCYGVPLAAFHSNPSLHTAKNYSDKSASINARISAMLQQVLCASRFAHYLKVMIRDKVGSYATEQECEQFLTRWIHKYTTGRDDLSWEMRAQYPLRDARLTVREIPGKPGQYLCVIYLKPHYIAENLVSELKLTTELSNLSIGAKG